MFPCRLETTHFVPGRLRVLITGLRGNRKFAKSLEKTFANHESIHLFKANSQTGKALIVFDPTKVSKVDLVGELNHKIQLICQRVIPADSLKRIEKKKTRNLKKENDIFEPEDLPLQTQIFQVSITGAILLALLLKRIFWGRSAIANSSKVHTVAAATTIVTGYPILRSGIENLLTRKKLNNDFLISAATLVSLLLKESITGLVVVWLVNLSTLFQTFTLDKSRKAIKDMLQGKEETAWLEIDGTLVSVPIETIKEGNVIAVHIGEKIPVDGEVIDGEAAVSQAIITGESMPITKKSGDKVFAGSILEQGTLKVKAEKVGKDTSVARIIHLVEEASEVRAPIENIADRYSDKIVPLSFGLAGLIYLLTRDFKRSMTMLIVACPCAAGLSTPTAISAAMGNGARNGILIKGGNYLERIGESNVVLFDKTGTLTEGKPKINEVVILQKNLTEEKIIQLAASIEQQTNHPLAKAVVEKAEILGLQTLEVIAKEVIVGHGVKGIIDEQWYFIGSQQLMEENDVNIYRAKPKANRLKLLGQTVLFVAREKSVIGLIGIADQIRPESKKAINRIRHLGIENIGLITGDCTETADIVGKELGIDQIYANTLPEGKVDLVKKYQKENQVVTMVGEGINDSPALAKADIGIAMGTGGTDVAIESADVVLAGDNPEKIPALIKLSNHTMEVVRQNFIFAVGANAIGLILGAGKIISPLTAAILHNLSTFGVVVNSSRLLNFPIDGEKRRSKLGKTSRTRKRDETGYGPVKRDVGFKPRGSKTRT